MKNSVKSLLLGLVFVTGTAFGQGIKSEQGSDKIVFGINPFSTMTLGIDGTFTELLFDDDVQIQSTASIILIPGTPANSRVDIGDFTVQQNVPVAGASGNMMDLFPALTAMDGSDTVQGFIMDFTNADHTGTGNTLHGIHIDSINPSGGDADATEIALHIGGSWDYALMISPQSTLAAFDDPPTNRVGFFIDEGTDRVGGGAIDCVLVARLSDGTEINLNVLVSDGLCP